MTSTSVVCVSDASKECIQLKARVQSMLSMEILKMTIFPVTLLCKGLLSSSEVLGHDGGEQLSSVSLIFSKEQIEYKVF